MAATDGGGAGVTKPANRKEFVQRLVQAAAIAAVCERMHAENWQLELALETKDGIVLMFWRWL